ncbi:MAG: DUF547 domain-containing protein [Anaerohalosphaera sp.]|nr:DUF547 domain-containing protein [Anaerohalosphaera sp.]
MASKFITLSIAIIAGSLVCLAPTIRVAVANEADKSDARRSSNDPNQITVKSAAKDSASKKVKGSEEDSQASDNKDNIASETKPAENSTSDNDETQVEILGEVFYKKYGNILAEYVDKDGNVNYRKLRRKRGDLYSATRELDQHTAEFFFSSKAQKKAFWINTHNALTLQLIVNNYPIEKRIFAGFLYPENSIKQIAEGRNRAYFNVIEFDYKLEEIEKEELLEGFKDIRVPFALSFACMGSANLRNEVYEPNKLDEQLDDQVRKFVRSDKGVKIDKAKKVVYLSDIFNWYKDDFINSKFAQIKKFRKYDPHIKSVLNFIVGYMKPEDAEYIESQSFEVDFQPFNWWLNEQRPSIN